MTLEEITNKATDQLASIIQSHTGVYAIGSGIGGEVVGELLLTYIAEAYEAALTEFKEELEKALPDRGGKTEEQYHSYSSGFNDCLTHSLTAIKDTFNELTK